MDVREKMVDILGEFLLWPSKMKNVWMHQAIEKLADHLIANSITVQEWISVAKRLPDIGVEVLVYSENFGIHVDYYDGDAFGYFHVTHWTPLPEPPKGE